MHGGIDGGGTVVSAVPGERSHRTLDLIEQRRNFGGIVTVVIGQGGGDNLTSGDVAPPASSRAAISRTCKAVATRS